jgi:hypothetical protein
MRQQGLDVQAQNFKSFTIVYTGSLYPQQQSAEPLFGAIKNLLEDGILNESEFKILVCGKDGALWQSWAMEFGLANILEDRGMLNHAESLSLQLGAHVNLLLSWNSPGLQGILSAKVFEYLQAKRPILAIVNGSTDVELGNLISTYSPGSLVVYPNQTLHTLTRFLQTEYQNWQQEKKNYLSLPDAPSWENEIKKLF